MNWKDVVAGVAPGLATVLGGPLAGGIVSILAEKMVGGSTGDPAADQARITDALAGGLTPQIRQAIIESEATFKLEAMKAGLEEKRIDLQREQAGLLDVQSARDSNVKIVTSADVPWYIKARPTILAYMAVLGFLSVLAGLLTITAFKVVIDGSLKDILIYALGALTTIVITVYNFDFGSSGNNHSKDSVIAALSRTK